MSQVQRHLRQARLAQQAEKPSLASQLDGTLEPPSPRPPPHHLEQAGGAQRGGRGHSPAAARLSASPAAARAGTKKVLIAGARTVPGY